MSHQTIWNSLHQCGLCARRPARVPDHTTRHRRHCLAWASEHLHWTRDQRASVLFSVESRFRLSRNYGHQRCRKRQGECDASATVVTRRALVVVVLQFGQVCLVNTELPNTLWMVKWQPHTTWITSLILSLCSCMNSTGLISSSWTTMLQLIAAIDWGTSIEWPALSPDLNPIENLWDQRSCRVEARNAVPQNDLRAVLLEEWDAMPQLTITNNIQHCSKC